MPKVVRERYENGVLIERTVEGSTPQTINGTAPLHLPVPSVDELRQLQRPFMASHRSGAFSNPI
jgi:hypothetical protein